MKKYKPMKMCVFFFFEIGCATEQLLKTVMVQMKCDKANGKQIQAKKVNELFAFLLHFLFCFVFIKQQTESLCLCQCHWYVRRHAFTSNSISYTILVLAGWLCVRACVCAFRDIIFAAEKVSVSIHKNPI